MRVDAQAQQAQQQFMPAGLMPGAPPPGGAPVAAGAAAPWTSLMNATARQDQGQYDLGATAQWGGAGPPAAPDMAGGGQEPADPPPTSAGNPADIEAGPSSESGKENHERESARQGARPRMKLSEAKGRPLTNSEMLITSFVADAGVEAADRQASSGMPTMLV